jgi:hypothetical protein
VNNYGAGEVVCGRWHQEQEQRLCKLSLEGADDVLGVKLNDFWTMSVLQYENHTPFLRPELPSSCVGNLNTYCVGSGGTFSGHN